MIFWNIAGGVGHADQRRSTDLDIAA